MPSSLFIRTLCETQIKMDTMKFKNILLTLLAIGAIFGCNKIQPIEEQPIEDQPVDEQPIPNYTVSFLGYVESDDAPEPATASKVVVATNSKGKLQNFWENGDKVDVYSSGTVASGEESTNKKFTFSTTLNAPNASALFYYPSDDFVNGDKYIAIYPSSGDHTVNFTAKAIEAGVDERLSYHMDRMQVPQTQTLVPGSFDRNIIASVAYSENLSSMTFKNTVALVKFRVSESNITSGSIRSDNAPISGTFKATVVTEAKNVPKLITYKRETYSEVKFSLENNAPLEPGVDYYVALSPQDSPNGFSIYLNNTLVKRYDVLELKRSYIYNLGTLSIPNPNFKHLSFDFSTNTNFVGDWPTASTTVTEPRLDEFIYRLNGLDYGFLLTDCTDATTTYVFWNTNGYIQLSTPGRYLGLPVIPGYKLIKVTCLHATSANTNGNGRGMGVVSNITKNKDVAPNYVAGGEVQYTKLTGDYLVYNLEGTQAGTRYYLYLAERGIGLSNISLVYAKDDAPQVTTATVRLGCYNVTVYKSGTYPDGQTWDQRKSRIIQSIKDCNFDVFGVNECSAQHKTYFDSNLTDYAGLYFNPYSSDGAAGGNTQYVGILYKKSDFSVVKNTTNYFWQAATLDATVSKPSSPNDDPYYRGGLCVVLQHKASGKNFFFMVTHGAKLSESRVAFAPVFEMVEKKYNTNGYPSFFVGDLNARPYSPVIETYRQYWKDAYLKVDPDYITGPFATYCDFDVNLDLMTDKRRIDYILYRGATPLTYVCSDKKYDGYYPSDHLPIYSDMLLAQ